MAVNQHVYFLQLFLLVFFHKSLKPLERTRTLGVPSLLGEVQCVLKCSQGRFLFILHKHSCLKRLLSAWYLSEPSSNALLTLRPRTVGAGAAGVVLACGGAGWGPWLGALAGGPGWV